MFYIFFVILIHCLKYDQPYNPKIEILIHKDCIYGKALKTLLDISHTGYKVLQPENNMNLLKDNKSVPKLYLNGKYIGGYKDAVKNWPYVFRSIPNESNFNNLFDPLYVLSKYGTKS